MALYTPLSLVDANAHLAGFDLKATAVEGMIAGSVNSNFRVTLSDGGRAFIRIYEEQDKAGALAEAAVLETLFQKSLPVVKQLTNNQGERILMQGEKPLAVFPWVEGMMRCQKSVTPQDMQIVGKALAAIHSTQIPGLAASRFGPAQLNQRLKKIEAEAAPQLQQEVPGLRDRLAALVEKRSQTQPHGLCHGDLFRDNVLWQGESLAALMDFESAAREPLAFDLAVTLLAWCYGDDFEPALAAALVAGYEAETQASEALRQALFDECCLASLRFCITRITDYAMRPSGGNEGRDYQRFLRRLAALETMGAEGLFRMVGWA